MIKGIITGITTYHYLKYLMTYFPVYMSEGREREALLSLNFSKEYLAWVKIKIILVVNN